MYVVRAPLYQEYSSHIYYTEVFESPAIWGEWCEYEFKHNLHYSIWLLGHTFKKPCIYVLGI